MRPAFSKLSSIYRLFASLWIKNTLAAVDLFIYLFHSFYEYAYKFTSLFYVMRAREMPVICNV